MRSGKNGKLLDKTTTRVVALGVFLMTAGLIGILAVLNPRPAGGGAGKGKGESTGPGPRVEPPQVDVGGTGFRSGGQARGKLFDPKRPDRLMGTFAWSAFDATGVGRARVTTPVFTLFLGNNLVAVVKAARGQLALSSRDQPESGTLEGGVPVGLYEFAGQNGEQAIDFDPEGREPIALLFCTSVGFNIALGELTLPGEFRFSSPAGELRGRGLRILGNQVASRIELIEMDSADYAWFDPSVKVRRSRGAGSSDASVNAENRNPGTAPVESFYSAVFGSDVSIKRQASEASAETMMIFARLIDGRLADNAIATPERAGSPGPGTPQPADLPATQVAIEPNDPSPLMPEPTPAPIALFAPPAAGTNPIDGEPASLARPGTQAIGVTWKGALTITPSETRPAALERDDLAVQLLAKQASGVQLTDNATGSHLEAASLTYGATARDLSINGVANEPSGAATIGQPGRGRVQAASIALNLGTGLGTATGPGLISGAQRDRVAEADAPREVAFDNRADFVFGSNGGWMNDQLDEITLDGNVRGRDRQGTVSADRVQARFAPPTVPTPADKRNILREVIATGNASAGNGKDSLSGDKLVVAFGPRAAGSGDSDPRIVTAEGSVTGSRGTTTLECGFLEAELERDSRNELVVGQVRVDRGITLTDKNLSVTADSCRADAREQFANLTGNPVRLTRDGASVMGSAVRLLGNSRELEVFGPGTFDYVRDATAERKPVSVYAAWKKGMRINDVKGRLECNGDTVARSSTGDAEVDTMEADRVNLDFTPGAVDSKDNPPDRQLIRAELVAAEGPDGKAKINSTRYASTATPGERTVERLIYVEGRRILGEQLDGPLAILSVPGAGKFLIDDRRAAKADPTPPTADGPLLLTQDGGKATFGGARGTSLFTWAGELKYLRADGLITLRDGVRLLHRQSPTDPLTTLDCNKLEATVRTAKDTTDPRLRALEPGKQAELVRATATGGPVVQSDGKRLEADVLNFEALSNFAEAVGLDGNRVSFSDPAKPTPLSAERLFWDFKTGRITVERPAPVTIPR